MEKHGPLSLRRISRTRCNSCLFAGTQKDNYSMLHTVIHFKSEEHLKRFGADEELTRLRAEAGAIVETGTFTPITDEAFINYPNVQNLG